jgi:hypothetical protein
MNGIIPNQQKKREYKEIKPKNRIAEKQIKE